MARPRTSPQPEVPGLAARRTAADILDGVLRRRIALDELLSGKNAHPGLPGLADRDRALTRRLTATVLRRLGTLRHLVGGFLDKGFPSDAPRIETILLLGAAQILWLEVPDHAAVDLSVRLAQADRRAARYAGLVNAVLRRVTQSVATKPVNGASRDTPEWLLKRWKKAYGADTARAIAVANGHEPALDLTVKQDAESWAERLRGRVLPTGTVRTLAHGAISLLPGFSEGAWWVQDAAAALPVRLFGDVRSKTIAELCAAPGGKTAQLALAGAQVIAIDRSPVRLNRLRENLGAPVSQSRNHHGRRTGLAGRTVRRRLARCAVLGHRHDPSPSRYTLAQERGRSSGPHIPAATADRSRSRADKARRDVRILRLLTGAGREPKSDRSTARARPPHDARIPLRHRRSSAKLTSLPSTVTCAHCRSNYPIPTRAGAASMASMRRGSQDAGLTTVLTCVLALYRPFAIVCFARTDSHVRQETNA